MGILGIILLVFFIIVAILLILMVLIQDEGGEGMGGIFGGSSNSTFGSRTGNVMTRFTGILGALFLVFALGLAFVNRSGSAKGVEKAAKEELEGSPTEWWKSPEPAATANPAAGANPAAIDGGVLDTADDQLPAPKDGKD